jgi:hypothetical protein
MEHLKLFENDWQLRLPVEWITWRALDINGGSVIIETQLAIAESTANLTLVIVRYWTETHVPIIQPNFYVRQSTKDYYCADSANPESD